MAKISLSKFNLKKQESIEKITFNDQEIEIKQYLPIDEKLTLISKIVNDSVDGNGFYNPARIYIYSIIYTIDAYTNISFTKQQLENITKTYDLVVSSGLSAKVFEALNPYEIQQLNMWTQELIDSIYKYRNSVLGILENIKNDYDELNLDATAIEEKLSNKENLALLRDVLQKMG